MHFAYAPRSGSAPNLTGKAAMVYFLAFAIFEAAWFIPFRIVFKTAHFNALCAYLSLIPILGPLACVWILASKPWPLKTKIFRVQTDSIRNSDA